ncbi:kynureninase [Nocardioides marmoriginsengisoli]|uniref:Kynureninase n=1 Tax=Nocardioides marmoriginsengisoli TaxID=661483 RepID=A0A3N0CR02_9ACTN|nr:kynureninase [Nocardioides marmoriginsengisoli]RNL65343.1 kynureninase [Nocardioides marmoriginsengisoli]
MTSTRTDAVALDESSPLRHTRARFVLPEGVIYLDGNSLGALPAGVAARLAGVVEGEWGTGLIRSWNDARWMELVGRIAARIAPLVGARGADLHVGDSTSVSLFKTMVAAARLRPGRRVIVVEPSTFPTDGYIAAGVADLLGLELRWCDPADPVAAVDEDVALLTLTHVDFRTGAMYDMAAITAAAQARGALVQWDLCHSAGAVPVDLEGSGADFAVGCTYKYLNGGPGAPAFTWVSPGLQADARQPITGWMGHASPFAMTRDFAVADGMTGWASGTHPVLALSALETALEAFDGVTVEELRAASLSLTDLFLRLLDERLPELEIVTPRDHARRGSQVSFRHEHAYGIVQALIARGVIGDFRDDGAAPGIARFGFTPLYLSHADVHDAVEHLVAVLAGAEHLAPEYAERNAVT